MPWSLSERLVPTAAMRAVKRPGAYCLLGWGHVIVASGSASNTLTCASWPFVPPQAAAPAAPAAPAAVSCCSRVGPLPKLWLLQHWLVAVMFQQKGQDEPCPPSLSQGCWLTKAVAALRSHQLLLMACPSILPHCLQAIP